MDIKNDRWSNISLRKENIFKGPLHELLREKKFLDTYDSCQKGIRKYSRWGSTVTNTGKIKLIGTRIDHIIVSKNLSDRILASDIEEQEFIESDHRIIWCSIDMTNKVSEMLNTVDFQRVFINQPDNQQWLLIKNKIK